MSHAPGIFRHFLVAAFSLALGAHAHAGNPIITDKGVCDPEIRIYGDRAYLYATHDADPHGRHFLMHDWWVWASDDLVNWTEVSVLKPEETYWKKPCSQCWATNSSSHDGKYYFYFSRTGEEMGVVEGDTPAGPWRDPLGKPFIAKGSVPTAARDPGILQLDDGTAYLVFGCWDFYLARLGDDRISLAETPREVMLDHKEGPYGPGKTDDKPNLHKFRDKYYLSWGCFYAMSDDVYGPYTYKGSVITQERTAPEFQKRLVYDRHGSFFEFHGQWYFVCNDQSWPGSQEFFRDSIISYVHYHDDGTMDPVHIDRIGVGQYDAAQPRIEAENYFRAGGVTQMECPGGGFQIGGLRDGSYALYPKVMNLPARAVISFRVASAGPQAGVIEIRRDAADGPLLGRCPVPGTGAWTAYETVSAPLDNAAGQADVCLVFRGGAGEELMRLDWLSFQGSKAE